MSKNNETVVKRFIVECINRKKVELMDKLFSPDYINHAATPDISPDLEGYKERLRYMIAALPTSVSPSRTSSHTTTEWRYG